MHDGIGIEGCILVEIDTTGVVVGMVIADTEVEREPTVLEGDTLSGYSAPCSLLVRQITAIEL